MSTSLFAALTGDTGPVGTVTRLPDASWAPLVRGQRVTVHAREWRVTEADTAPDGTETYTLEPAEVVDEREARRRALRAAPMTGPGSWAGPLYSYEPDTSGPRGGPGSMVMSIACAEGRCEECDAWFRCDHEHHRRQSGRALPTLEVLRTAAEQQFGGHSSPDGVYWIES